MSMWPPQTGQRMRWSTALLGLVPTRSPVMGPARGTRRPSGMVAGPQCDDALAICRRDLELVKGERQRGLAIGSLDGTEMHRPRATNVINQPVRDLGGLAGLGI